MSKLKHTPGPWVKDYGHTEGHIKTLHNPKVHTKTVIKYRCNMCEEILTEEEIEANARLISAAPEMLDDLIDEARKQVIRISAVKNIDEFIKNIGKTKIMQTIEKATGLTIEEILNEN